ncbi:peptidoglycan DD-metalloendopeptidase family protein [Pseudalkalibacillus sp. A8]|uniref:peptidoglycan DD-metalloendopeptidase family protein n=1 Tax=Pseudalkalibacillus sp. A8 TaxID=3382641 RepID=UPI0038B5ED90
MKKVLMLFLGTLFVLSYMANSDIVSAKSSTKVKEEIKWDWPVEGMLTDHFGTREGSHFGVDIAAEKGKEIRVVEKGTITKSYYSDSYGNVIFVKHPNGMETLYAHMSERLAEEGEKVDKGSIIGLIGNTGKSRGDHLHFEVHMDEWNINKTNAVDPLAYLTDQQKAVNVNTPHIENKEKVAITIAQGDTLWSISQKYDVSVDELIGWNDLDSNLIIVGQTLYVLKQKI